MKSFKQSKLVITTLVITAFALAIPSTLLAQKASKKIKYKYAESGLGYAYIKKNKKGTNPKAMDMVQVLYTSSLPDGTEIASMQDSSNYLEFVVGNNEVLKGWDEALLLMKTGEEMQFLLPPQLAYGEKSFGKIKSNSTIILNVKLLGHYPAFYSKPNEEFLTTESGLKYKIYKPNIAKEPLVPGNYVLFSYTGYTIDLSTGKRTIFESSNRTKATTYVQYGVGNFVKGLEEGFSLLGVGDFATFILPPNLAYGNKDNKLVPANSVVGFDIYVQEQSNPFFSNELPMTKDDKLGYSYAFAYNKASEEAKLNDIVTLDLIGYYYTSSGAPKIFESTYEKGQPQQFRLGNAIENPAWLDILLSSSVGDKVKFKIPAENARTELKKLVPEGKDVYFEYQVLSIAQPEFLSGKIFDSLRLDNQLKIDYYTEQLPSKVVADTNTMVAVHYVGYYTDSLQNKVVFDSSFERSKPFIFNAGKGEVIKGWDIALQHLSEGDWAKVHIPSELAYGKRGVPPLILQDQDLIFDIYVVKFFNPDIAIKKNEEGK